MRSEILASAGGYAHDVAVTTYGRYGRVEDQRGTELGRHRVRECRVPTRDAHRLRLAVEHAGGYGCLLGNEEHREVGELRVVERHVGLLRDESCLRPELE